MAEATERPCPHAGKGGPCWGRVRLVDVFDTESQHVEYYACEGHVDVARYGYEDRYRPEPRWTTATPTVPGYYWWRKLPEYVVPRVCWVSDDGWAAMVGVSVRLARNLGGEWYGPLTAPED